MSKPLKLIFDRGQLKYNVAPCDSNSTYRFRDGRICLSQISLMLILL